MILESQQQRLEWDRDRGGRLISWQVQGKEVLAHHGDDPVEYGMYAMAPWSGRLHGNTVRAVDMQRLGVPMTEDFVARVNYPPWALHGTCFTAPIDQVDQRTDSLVTRQWIPDWPWRAELVAEWLLVPGGLDLRLSVEAHEPCPAIIGWHPWFRKEIAGAHAQWQAPAGRMAVRDPQSERGAFPSGEWRDLQQVMDPVDDAFVITDHEVTVTWPGTQQLRVTSSHPWFVIFDELPDALCIEPQTQLPNAWRAPLDGEADIAKPGHPLVLRTQWRWSTLA